MRALAATFALLCLVPATAFAADADLPSCRLAKDITPPVRQTAMTISDYYPQLSTFLGEEGNTIVRYTVQPNGTVSGVSVEVSSKFTRLDEAAVEAVTAMLFKPALKAGQPVACENKIELVWRLRGDADNDPLTTLSKTAFVFQPPASLFPKGTKASGVSVFSVQLGADGSIGETKVRHSSGDAALDDAALAYIKTLKMHAATVNGKPGPTYIGVAVVWAEDRIDLSGAKPAKK